MNREILFRGQSLETGEWVYGYLTKGTFYYDEELITAIIPIDVTFYPRCELSGYEPVHPETVGQYTGLKDKNGNKVFEGDILESIVRRVGIPGTRIVVGDIRRAEKIALWVSGYEVVGNIWDNPELLENKE